MTVKGTQVANNLPFNRDSPLPVLYHVISGSSCAAINLKSPRWSSACCFALASRFFKTSDISWENVKRAAQGCASHVNPDQGGTPFWGIVVANEHYFGETNNHPLGVILSTLL